ncbi:MAG: hypothetical protein B7Z60_06855 [Ferrovum sp. 37-45-19]|jgi:hypothetical protein|uniref:hypothetical protein n=1 Tax=Ferrovum sp. JA12 TaxID=1356299 RepID=UPI000703C045|nr:hypothetical protein [Ferrovum sp. JA12]OYV78779.1 MAG: hypothetical protein B7Z65_08990 [Ferrovum sp. 21-44-67]OYV93915.1 MAG: hypothetical protein B7Z60_06855 [Ferrovum sp. 37-45-19]OZB32017.1 MAG: hypothetical protein B7X47_07805 [Ferrovum sp. 34-44-207]HQT81972.1 hypothetical protein [Ferrovaceae bacterium]KRH78954.1 hypothetical protein FERRO_00150 [Ferrovum sp. JA12]
MTKLNKQEQAQFLLDAVDHLKSETDKHEHINGAFRGLVYSVVETLGQLVGDPELPQHMKSGIEGALEVAREIQHTISHH